MKDLMNRQVIRELKKISKIGLAQLPPAGWIRTIREVLGMTATQLAKRLGVVQQRVSALEKSEINGALKLKSLEEAAHALNCRLVYFFVPNEPLEKTLEDRAFAIAGKRIDQSTHSMNLESQPISKEERHKQFDVLVKELLTKRTKELWDEE